MLLIRSDQMETFREEAQRSFVRRLCDHLYDRVPDYLSDLDPKFTLEHVKELVSIAQKLGFRSRDQIRRFAIVTAAACGRAGETPPAWLIEIAKRPRSSAPMRLQAIEEALLHVGPKQRDKTP